MTEKINKTRFLAKKDQNSWVKYKDTLGERQKAVWKELRKAPATIFELAGRMGLPTALVSSCVTELIKRDMVRALRGKDGFAVTRNNPFNQLPTVVVEAITAYPEKPGFGGGKPL
jgi:predicted Rossmann fold nucleotide-binding protein DprA/Smf involved in DNA uptake